MPRLKTNFVFILILVFCQLSYAQIEFEKGYFVDNNYNRIECLVKNVDWKDNPSSFEYKSRENSKVNTADISDVIEFGIYNELKFERHEVNIDRSSDRTEKLSENKAPEFSKETLYLRVLVQGKFDLYQFEDANVKRYFFRVPNEDMEPLVYKKYKAYTNSATSQNILENIRFKQQLWLGLDCPSMNKNVFKNISYHKKELTNLLIEANNYHESEIIYLEQQDKGSSLNLSLRPRVNYTSLSIDDPSAGFRSTEFESAIGFGVGLELEYILPYNKNKWAIIAEPTYQSFASVQMKPVDNLSGGILVTDINYKSIELPVGLRHYFFLNEKSKLFLNIVHLFDFQFGSTLDFTRADGNWLSSLDVKAKNNRAFGIGYSLGNKFSAEFRYHTSRNILGNYLTWNADYRTISFILGYTFL